MLTGCQPERKHSEVPKLGMHLLLEDGRFQWPTSVWQDHMQVLADALPNGGYVTQLVRFDDLDVTKWQLFLDLCAEYQFVPIVRLATTFDLEANWWGAPVPDEDGRYQTVANSYVNFLSQLDWHALPRLIVVGNEPNHGNEWGGVPNPVAYARFLRDVATALHAWDESVVVMNAGMDAYTPHTNGLPFVDGMAYMDSESFLQGMIESDPTIFRQIDAWASHPYPMGPFSAPPAQQTFQIDYLNGATNPHHVEPPDTVFNRGIQGYEWELWWLAQHGETDLPVYITETGWRFHDNLSHSQTVDYLDSAWRIWREDSRVQAVTFFALNGNPKEWGAHTNWLILDDQGRILEKREPFGWLARVYE